MDEKEVDGVVKLLNTVVGIFGEGGTLVLIFGFLGLAMIWRVYTHRRRDRETHGTIAAMEGEVQRLANQNRLYRIDELKRNGWSLDEIERLVIKNEAPDSKTSRRNLEGADKGPGRSKQVKKRKRTKKGRS